MKRVLNYIIYNLFNSECT